MAGSGDRTFTKIKLSIDGYDMTDSWYEIRIYQSLDAPTWSCEIAILDARNLYEAIPIQHGSEIIITIGTQDLCETDDQVDFTFYVYTIGNKNMQNQNSETYKIGGVTKAFLENSTVRINQKYTGMKMTDVIADVASMSFPGMTIELPTESDNTNDLLINNWTPFVSIGWLLKQTHKDNRADFMFFQCDHNAFRVESIESMYSDSKNKLDSIVTYRVENAGDLNHYNIIQHSWEHVDVQQNLQNGYYKSTVVSYDFFNKKWDQTIYTHGDDNKEDLRIAPQWKDALFNNAENAAISFIPKMPKSFDSETGYDDADKWVPSRRAVLQRLDSEKFSAQLRGSVGVYRWLGKHIYIDMPNNKAETEEHYSKFRKGYYLISAITHFLTPSSYINNYEFVKMRLEQDDNTQNDGT